MWLYAEQKRTSIIGYVQPSRCSKCLLPPEPAVFMSHEVHDPGPWKWNRNLYHPPWCLLTFTLSSMMMNNDHTNNIKKRCLFLPIQVVDDFFVSQVGSYAESLVHLAQAGRSTLEYVLRKAATIARARSSRWFYGALGNKRTRFTMYKFFWGDSDSTEP